MDGFIFLPVESGEVKSNSFTVDKIEKEEGEESVGFEQLLSPFLFSWGTGEVTPVKSCSSSSSVSNCSLERSTCSPCSLSGADTFSSGACSLSSSSSLEEMLNVEGWQKTIDSFLSEVENISFTLNLGEKGKVSVSGGTGEDGKFTFQISGDKEALSELLGRVVKQVVAFLSEQGFSYPGGENSFSECSLGQGCGGGCSGEGIITSQIGEIQGDTELGYIIPDDLLPPEEGEENAIFSDVSLLPDVEVEVEGERIILPEVEGEETITPNITQELEDISKGEATTSQERQTNFASLEETQGEAEVMRVYASPERNLFSSNEAGENTAEGKKVEMVLDLGGMLARGDSASVKEVINFSPVEEGDLSKVFDRVLQAVSQSGGEKEVVITLKPEFLGSIVLQVREENNRVECVWQISDPRTQEIVTKNLPVLEAHMSEQGMWLNNYMNQNGHYFSYSGKPYYFSPSVSENGEDATTFSILDNVSGKVNILV